MSKIIGVTTTTPYKGGLPKVTEDDNGKFLRAVDGAYVLVALTDVSKEGA